MKERLPFSYGLAIAWTFLAAAGLQALLGVLVAFRPSAAYDLVSLGGVEAVVFLVGVFGLLSLHGRTDVPLSTTIGVRPTHPALTALAVALGVASHFPAEFVDAVFQKFVPTPPDEVAARTRMLTADTPLQLALILFVVACVGPLVEEMFFRGALYGTLRRTKSLLGATLMTSFCFVIGHLDMRLWPALTLVAVVMTYLRSATGSLLPSLSMHVAFNATTELAIVSGQTPLTGPPQIEVVPAAIGSFATAVLVFGVRYVASRAKQARRGRAEDAE